MGNVDTQPNNMPFRHIVVGIADDDASMQALTGAAQLADRLQSALHIVHSIDGVASLAEVEGTVRDRITKGLVGTRFAKGDLHSAVVVEEGEATDVLLNEANRVSGDLIVIGPHRKRRFDFGSTAKDLMKQAVVPTLIQIGAPRSHQAILIAVDLTTGSRATLKVAHALAVALESKLVLVHCYEGPAFAYEASAGDSIAAPNYVIEGERNAERKEFEAFVKDFAWGSVEVESVFVEDDPAQYILERQNSVDFVVVGRHGRRGILGSLGSLSAQLHKQLSSPLLIVPHE